MEKNKKLLNLPIQGKTRETLLSKLGIKQETLEKISKKKWKSFKPDTPPITQDQILTEIANETMLTKKDVSDVLESFVKIYNRELVVTGSFRWNKLFSCSTKVQSDVLKYEPDIEALCYYPEGYRPSIKMSPFSKDLYKLARKNERAKAVGVTRLNGKEFKEAHAVMRIKEKDFIDILDKLDKK